MKDLFVPYEIAVQLKELGFDEPCFGFYTYKSEIRRYTNFDGELNDFQTIKNSKITMGDNWATSPTFSQAFEWFREKHNAHHSITRLPQGALDADAKNKKVLKKYAWFVSKDDFNPTIPQGCSDKSNTYKEAELACLIKLIEIVKNK